MRPRLSVSCTTPTISTPASATPNRRLRQARHADDPADGIGAVEPRAFEGLIDQRDLPASRDVGAGTATPLRRRNPERPRIVRADLVHDERLVVTVEPGTSTRQPPLPNGCAAVLTAAAVTPGTRAMLGSSSSKKSTRRAGSGYLRSGSGTRIVNTRSG